MAWSGIATYSALALGHREHFLVTKLVSCVNRESDERFWRQRDIPMGLKEIHRFAGIQAGAIDFFLIRGRIRQRDQFGDSGTFVQKVTLRKFRKFSRLQS